MRYPLEPRKGGSRLPFGAPESSDGEEQMSRKQLIFIEEYVSGASGAQAAIKAGYSANSARQIAFENLTKPYISKQIQE